MPRRLLPMIVLLILLLPAPLSYAQRPDAPPYALRGPYPVGTLEVTIDGIEGVTGQEKPLNATVWYPALNPDGLEEETTYRLGLIPLPGHALQDATPDVEHGPYPLVVFSHGNGGMRFQSLYLTEHLASHGFVVIAADHPGNTALDMLFGGSQADFLATLITSFGTRPLDVLRQIGYMDTVTAGDGPLSGLVDTDRIAVSGHSFGGYTALAAAGARLNFAALDDWCAAPELVNLEGIPAPALDAAELRSIVCFLRPQRQVIAAARGLDAVPDGPWPATTDPRIRAAVLLAPYAVPVFGPDGLASVTVPALFLVGSTDSVTTPQRDAYAAFRDIGSADRTLAVFENGDHYLFADACSPVAIQLGQFDHCSDPVWDMARAHDLTNHLVTAFLRARLYEDAEAAAALEAADFRGLILRRAP